MICVLNAKRYASIYSCDSDFRNDNAAIAISWGELRRVLRN